MIRGNEESNHKYIHEFLCAFTCRIYILRVYFPLHIPKRHLYWPVYEEKSIRTWSTFSTWLRYGKKPCADGVVVIAISLFPEVPGSIPEGGKKRRFLWKRLFVHAVHLLSFFRRSDPFLGITSPWRAILGWAKATFGGKICKFVSKIYVTIKLYLNCGNVSGVPEKKIFNAVCKCYALYPSMCLSFCNSDCATQSVRSHATSLLNCSGVKNLSWIG